MSENTENKQEEKQSPEGWEREILEKMLMSTLKEQRAKRRWGIFFRCVFAALTICSIWLVFSSGRTSKEGAPSGKHVALIKMDGVISSSKNSAAKSLLPALRKAFENEDSAGVILRINSPGGSPVQAGLVNDEIRRLRKKYPQKPLYVVVHEVCASGAYYIAAAADKIYVDKASLVGSIGVLINGFGFTEIMKKIGVERRLMTAGENKGFLDPFSPQSPKQTEHVQAMLDEIHSQFIEVVRQGRGSKLKEMPGMFSGLMWTGSKAIDIGLADGYGSVGSVARDALKTTKVVDYTVREGFPDLVLKRLGTSIGSGFMQLFWEKLEPEVK